MDEESDPWESIGRSLEDEIEQERLDCASARLLPANTNEDYVPAMPRAAKVKDAPTALKLLLSTLIVGSL